MKDLQKKILPVFGWEGLRRERRGRGGEGKLKEAGEGEGEGEGHARMLQEGEAIEMEQECGGGEPSKDGRRNKGVQRGRQRER